MRPSKVGHGATSFALVNVRYAVGLNITHLGAAIFRGLRVVVDHGGPLRHSVVTLSFCTIAPGACGKFRVSVAIGNVRPKVFKDGRRTNLFRRILIFIRRHHQGLCRALQLLRGNFVAIYRKFGAINTRCRRVRMGVANGARFGVAYAIPRSTANMLCMPINHKRFFLRLRTIRVNGTYLVRARGLRARHTNLNATMGRDRRRQSNFLLPAIVFERKKGAFRILAFLRSMLIAGPSGHATIVLNRTHTIALPHRSIAIHPSPPITRGRRRNLILHIPLRGTIVGNKIVRMTTLNNRIVPRNNSKASSFPLSCLRLHLSVLTHCRGRHAARMNIITMRTVAIELII